jgi:hypothetical protein
MNAFAPMNARASHYSGCSASIQKSFGGVPKSSLGQSLPKSVARATSAFPPIVLKKSFSPDKRKFLGPLMRFARGDVRDHIISGKDDHRPAYRRYGALQR